MGRGREPQEFWGSIEPSCAGSVHILRTGGNPASYRAEFLRRSQAEGTGFTVFFADRYSRQGRDSTWEDATRASMPADHFRREYPATIEDSFSGSGKNLFDSADIDQAVDRSLGSQEPDESHTYVCAWDVGRKHDASVGAVLDYTDPDLMHVVAWEYLTDTDFPSLQAVMKGLHNRYGADTAVEVTGLGLGARTPTSPRTSSSHGTRRDARSRRRSPCCRCSSRTSDSRSRPSSPSSSPSCGRARMRITPADTVMATAIAVASIESASARRPPKKARPARPILVHSHVSTRRRKQLRNAFIKNSLGPR